MGLDIRWPIGLMFTLIGVLLTAFGAIKKSDSMSLDININLIWGIVLLVFGVLMLAGAIRGGKNPPTA
jgi:sulfite exporter TauE/SafE